MIHSSISKSKGFTFGVYLDAGRYIYVYYVTCLLLELKRVKESDSTWAVYFKIAAFCPQMFTSRVIKKNVS